MSVKTKLGVAMMLCAGALPAATTFQELLDEIAAAENGATVYVENDIECTGCIISGIGKTITLASTEGTTNVLTRAASYTSGECMILNSDDDKVTLRDIVIDGNKASGTQSARFIDITGGTLTLDAGCELRNVWQNLAGSIRLIGTGRLEMNDGAVIRAFKNSRYGTAVMVGEGNNKVGEFFMNGGLITECDSTRSGGDNPGSYGGAVYCYGGKFYMYGGSITGNTGENCCAGLAGYSGEIHLKGTASITNNIGKVVNDISCWGNDGNSYIYFDGPWTGYATVYAPRVTGGENSNLGKWAAYVKGHSGFMPGSDFMPGLGKLSVQDHPEYVANGYTRNVDSSYLSVYFCPAVARIGTWLTTASWQEAINFVSDGDSINLFTDVTLDRTVTFGKGAMKLEMRSSDAGSPVTVTRNTEKSMFIVSNNVELTLRDIVIDGGAGESVSQGNSMIAIGIDGHLTLGSGAVLQNGTAKDESTGIRAVSRGATITMEEGSIVRNCRTTGTESWATAIRVGQNANDNPAVFTMNGGMISNCVSDTTGNPWSGYGGAVYVQNASFYMNGGTITGNSALGGGSAGIQTWNGGKVYFSGTATVTNNPGLYPDAYRNGNAEFYLRGDFRGCVGISHASEINSAINIIVEEGASGAWNFISAKTDPYGKYVGYMYEPNGALYFGTPDGSVDGRGVVCEYENFAHFTPTAIDAGNETLPHTFGGNARRAGGNVVVTFDEAAARAAGRNVIPLVAAVEGDVLTGTWTFELPAAAKGYWTVEKVRSGADVIAYRARWCPPGMNIIIR